MCDSYIKIKYITLSGLRIICLRRFEVLDYTKLSCLLPSGPLTFVAFQDNFNNYGVTEDLKDNHMFVSFNNSPLFTCF